MFNWGKIVKEAIKNSFSPMTLNYPFETREIPEDFRGVIQHSIEACIGCGNCERICPSYAIKMREDPKERTNTGKLPSYQFSKCITCGDCVDVCPTDALKHTEDFHKAEYEKAQVVWEIDKELGIVGKE